MPFPTLILTGLALMLAVPGQNSPQTGRSTAKSPVMVVALDAGHGGDQAGAHGICGAWEKDITLQIARRVAQVLGASRRAQPLLIRDDDETLALGARAERAHAAGAGLLVSIHANASTSPSARGVETFFLSLQASDKRTARLSARENEGQRVVAPKARDPLAQILRGLSLDADHVASQNLAMQLQRALVGHLHSRGRGVLQAPFMVLMGAQMPAALVEVGFLTHPEECVRLTTAAGQEAIAEAIAAGVLSYLGQQRPMRASALASGA